MSWLSDIFGWLADLLSDIWQAFKGVLPYIAIALALWVGLIGALPLTWLGIAYTIPAGWTSALFFIGASYLLAPEETTAVVTKVVSAAGEAVTAVAAAAGAAVGSAISAVSESSGLTSLLLIGGCGLAAYWLVSSKEENKDSVNQPTSTRASPTSTPEVSSLTQGQTSATRGMIYA